MGRLSSFVNMAKWERAVRSELMAKEFSKEIKALEKETVEILKKLDNLPKEFTERRRLYLLRKAGKEFVNSVQENIQDSRHDHYRYVKKVGNAEPTKITYKSGNLRKSIKVLRFRKAKNSIFVGPKVISRSKENNLTTFGANNKDVDPYYAHMVEYGTRHSAPQGYMKKGYQKGRLKALDTLNKGVKRIFKSYEKKNKKL